MLKVCKDWKQSMHPSIDEDKIIDTHTHTQWNITLSFNEKWNLAICNSMGRFWRYYAKWISQTEEDNYIMISLMWNMKN